VEAGYRLQTQAEKSPAASAAAGRIDEAIELWREATRRNPGIEAAWIKLALANAARGDTRQALEDARTCLNYHSDSAQARELVEKLLGQPF